MKQDRYSINRFCRFFKVARRTFYREVHRGHITPVKCGHRTFILYEEAQRWDVQRRKYHKMKCCASKSSAPRRKNFSIGGCFKLFFRKLK